MNGRCGDCRHFDPHAHDAAAAGTCRRYPPTALQAIVNDPLRGPQQVAASMSPPTSPESWCGEFAPRIAVTVQYGKSGLTP